MQHPEGLTSNPLVTVVTPTLQRRDRLAHTLKSVDFQTYPHIEHIVVDGGSTDGTQQMLQEWERERGVRWISEPDKGIYDAVNKGFALAKGTIFCYLNSDDLFFPWSVAVAVDALRNADLVYGDAIVLREEEGVLQFSPARPDLCRRPYLATIRQPAAFWRRTLYESLEGFRGERYPLVGDHDFWIRAVEGGFKVHKVREVLAAIGDHTHTATRVGAKTRALESRVVRREVGSRKLHARVINLRDMNVTLLRLKIEVLYLLWFSLMHAPRHWQHFLRHLCAKGLAVNLSGTFLSLVPGRRWLRLGASWPNIGERSSHSFGALLDFVSDPREGVE